MTDVEQLIARIESLETALGELRDELADARAGRFRSMARTHACPACGSRDLLRFPCIQKRGADDWLRQLCLYTRSTGSGPGGESYGPFETYACIGCGLIEWHAKQLDQMPRDRMIQELKAVPPPVPPAPPYR